MPAPRGMKPTVNNPAQILKRILNLVFKDINLPAYLLRYV